MRFQEKIRTDSKEHIWQEYCGFLDLTMEEYMVIQRRLAMEQIHNWSRSPLGQRFLKGKTPQTLEEFRAMVPLTTYADYADILLKKQAESLPDTPVLWIQTTWEGGIHPMKAAPYTKGMLDTYKRNMMACFILATGKGRNDFDVAPTDHMLYALAPLPYATGLMPLLLKDEIDIAYLPPVKEAAQMSFRERNVRGFKLGMKKGIEYFFGLGSVTYYISQSVSSLNKHSGGSRLELIRSVSPAMMVRYLKSRRVCRQENRELLPKDLFRLKGFMIAGTDNCCYKDDLERMWGVRPMELFAGTEPTCIGTETWGRNGMYFFPDACLYEFIPESEMLRNLEDPAYIPKTVLMDEVHPDEKYELVISVLKGGAFARYRVGDIYRCVGIGDRSEQTMIPRFAYIDRTPDVIDIAGFTRITENSINHALRISGLKVSNWFAQKEYTKNNRPQLHMYVELDRDALSGMAASIDVLKEHLTIYFKYLDSDYSDLKKILGVDPLNITIVKCGTFDSFRKQNGKPIRHMNPPHIEVSRFQSLM